MPAANAVPRAVRQAPVLTLLSWAWVAFTMEADNAFEAASADRYRRRFRISLAMWANGLRVIEEEGVTVAAARARSRAAVNLGGLERWGYIRIGSEGRGRTGYGSHRGVKPESMLLPTPGGSEARRLWPAAVAAVEEQWERRFGREVVGGLRDALGDAGTMPWSPPEVHSPDGFLTHVLDGPEEEADRPLVVRLGQVLTSLTLGAEPAIGRSLPVTANLLGVIDTSAVAIRDLPARAGVSKEAVAMGVNFLARAGLGKVSPQRLVQLTRSGLDVLDRYRAHKPRQVAPGLRAALVALLSRPELLATGLVPPAGCWRGEGPYRAQTERLLADPLGSLPRHPMVLHRGGWPDGS